MLKQKTKNYAEKKYIASPDSMAERGQKTRRPQREALAVDTEYIEDEQIFTAGARTIQDIVAPTSVEVAKDYLCIDGRYVRYLMVTGLPRRLNAGWVEDITGMKIPLQICFHFSPFDPRVIVRKLEFSLNQIAGKRMLDMKEGRMDKIKDDVVESDIQRILRGVEEGTIRIFSMSLTIGVHASTLERLNQRVHFMMSQLRQQQLELREALLQQDGGWKTCSPGPDQLLQRTNLDNASLAMCLPFTSSVIGTGDGAFLGFSDADEPMFFNPWSKKKNMPNGSIVVCGESGQGKSYLTKKLALGMMSMGNVDCVVIDKDGDYDPLCDYLGTGESQSIQLSHGCPLNPFDLPFAIDDIKAEQGQDFLSEHIDNSLLTFLSMLLAHDGVLSKHEEALLYQALVKTYEGVGLSNREIVLDPTILETRPAPLMVDLIKTVASMPQSVEFTLTERLEKASYLFRNHTSVALDKALTVFSIQGLDEAQYPLMIYTVKNFLQRNRAQLRYERFLLFLIEEASFMLRNPRGRKYLEESSRGVRKFGIAQATISQHPNDFLRDGEVIVANAGTCFFLGMEASAVEKLKLTPHLEHKLAHAKRGEVVCRIGNEYSHFRVVASPEEHKLFTTDPQELMEARAKKKARAKSANA